MRSWARWARMAATSRRMSFRFSSSSSSRSRTALELFRKPSSSSRICSRSCGPISTHSLLPASPHSGCQSSIIRHQAARSSIPLLPQYLLPASPHLLSPNPHICCQTPYHSPITTACSLHDLITNQAARNTIMLSSTHS